MKREPWAIANTFAYAIRILNSIFCTATKESRVNCTDEWTEEEKEMGEDNKWLIAEQINSMCSDMMIEDAQDMLIMVHSIPTGRLCEKTDCHFHHPPNPHRSSYVDVSRDKCAECKYNKAAKISNLNHYIPD